MPFKDLPEGQTHYYNDGCGEPAHNDTPKQWEIEFDEKFADIDGEDFMGWIVDKNNNRVAEWEKDSTGLKTVKDFINKTIRSEIEMMFQEAGNDNSFPTITDCDKWLNKNYPN